MDHTEDRQTRPPPLSLFLAYAAVVPIPIAALLSLMTDFTVSLWLARLTVVWSGAVLCFLAGVRRGLSFRQEGGATFGQLAAMLWLFLLGALALLLPWRVPALVLLLVGYASLALLDPMASHRGEAPRYFVHLRPLQMLIPVLGLIVLLAER